MAKSTSTDRRAELQRLRDWCLIVFTFESTDEQLNARMVRDADKAVESGNLRGLRMLAKDGAEMASFLPEGKRAQLDEILRRRTGRGLVDEEAASARALARIVRRGHITTEDDYHVVNRRVDELSRQRPDDPQRVLLGRMLLKVAEDGLPARAGRKRTE